jgi:polyisoprenoid-binding protein YceI
MMIRRMTLAQQLGLLMMLLCASIVSAAQALYSVEAAKSTLEFSFVQAGAQNKGRFPKFAVNFNFDADTLAASRLDVTIEVAALDTGDQERDDTLREPDLFNVAKFPQAHFAATQIIKTAAGYDASGTLLLRGVTRPLHVPFTLRSTTEQGRRVLYMTGKTLIKRLDFGVGQGDWKSTEWVANEVTVTFNLRLLAAS